MKKLAALILTGIMAFGCFSTAYAAETKVSVDGVPVVFTDAKPFVDENGRTMVPLRPIANAMGLEVAWDAATQTAAFTMALPDEFIEMTEDIYEAFGVPKEARFEQMSATLYFAIGESQYSGKITALMGNGEQLDMDAGVFPMDTVPVVKDGRTYAPVRYLAQEFGYEVGWEAATSTVTLTFLEW
ncbi:stalk domain-containing protein [Anaerotignum sp.]